MTKGRVFFGGTGAEKIKRAEELVEQEFGSVDAVIESDPELRAMRDAIAAEAAAEAASNELTDKPRPIPRRSRRPRKARDAA